MNWMMHYKRRQYFLITALLLSFVGTYNAVTLNSESSISSHGIKAVKRLDETYGVVTSGRNLATSSKWKKIPSMAKITVKAKASVKETKETSGSQSPLAAAINEDLDLELVEVVNLTKWQQGLAPNQFSGKLITNNGTIESLAVSLPDGQSIGLSYSEMSGNVFEYDMEGEVFSGIMYQVDQNSFTINLTNGPLEGTRMRFSKEAAREIAQGPLTTCKP